jgi:hypothetical protein
MNGFECVKGEFIEFFLVFFPDGFPAIGFPVVPAVQDNLVKFIIEGLFFALPLGELFP